MPVVLVTGAGSGFGEAIAVAFARAGYTTIASMRVIDAAPTSLKAVSTRDVELLELDVTSERSRAAAIATIEERHGRLDVLVNNAGIAPMASLEDTPETLQRQVFEINYFGAVEMMRLALPLMRRRKWGRIVNVSAIGAIYTTPLLSSYCASKHALDSVSASLDLEARAFGVRVSSILPGPFITQIGRKSPCVDPSFPYRELMDRLTSARARGAPPSTDLSPIVEAVLEAVRATEPRPRYLIPGALAERLVPTIVELERLHEFDAQRAGLPPTPAGASVGPPPFD